MNKNLLILGALLLVVIGGLLFVFKDRIPITNNDYTLPNSLTYSQNSGWSDVSGDGWTLSFKEDWQFKPLSKTIGSTTYYNKEQGHGLILVSIRPPALGLNSTIDNQLELWTEVGESSQSPTQLLNSQKLTINRHESGIIFSKANDRDYILLKIFIDKDGKIYTLDISTRENFYKSNKDDIEYLIASFR